MNDTFKRIKAKSAKLLFLICITFCLQLSVYAQDSLAAQLQGKWVMEQVLEAEADVTRDHNPENERWIEFKSDGAFASGGAPFGPNTGSYTFEASVSELYLDSDAGPDDDSRWFVAFEEQTMTWKGLGSPRAETFTLVHKRATEEP